MKNGGQYRFKDDMTGRLLQGRYRIVRRLAAGGMGVVYLARAEGAAGFVKPVVLKIIHPELARNRDYMGMFIREALILASLKHPGIVDVIEFIEEESSYHIMVLEYVHGFQLGEWRKFLRHAGRKIPVNLAIHIMINVLESLHYSHTVSDSEGKPMEIVHRDISPANIMLDTEGGIKLVDFGIARMTRDDASQGYLTETADTFRGKLAYSAPEMFTDGQPSIRSDIYSCGVTLHELLVSKNEFASPNKARTIHRVISHTLSPIQDSLDNAPPGIDEVLQKAVEKNPEERYVTAIDFAAALKSLQPDQHAANHMALGEILAKDFGKEMSDFLDVESLASRDRAWRLPSEQPQRPPTVLKEKPGGDLKQTIVERPLSRDAEYREQPQPATDDVRVVTLKLRYMLGAVILLLLFGSIVVYFTFRPERQSEDKYLLVQGASGIAQDAVVAGRQADSPFEQTAPQGDEPSQTNTQDTEPAPAERARPSPAKRKARTGADHRNALTDAVKKRQGKVRDCFDRHIKNLKGKPKISLTFTVARSGKVEKAGLSPTDLASTVLGKCLINVAKATPFPEQQERISFRIPITAWYGK